MLGLSSVATHKVLGRLQGSGGLTTVLQALSPDAPELTDEQFLARQMKPEVIDKHLQTCYPLVLVYCTRVLNKQAEKFRSFSGVVEIAIELKVSSERLDVLTDQVQLLADGVQQVLSGARGDWDDGMLYGGGYDVSFGPVRTGGRGFVQDAKIELALVCSFG